MIGVYRILTLLKDCSQKPIYDSRFNVLEGNSKSELEDQAHKSDDDLVTYLPLNKREIMFHPFSAGFAPFDFQLLSDVKKELKGQK